MVKQIKDEDGQIDRFKRLASDLGLSGEPTESLDRIMGKLNLRKKPDPEPKLEKK